MKNTHSQPVPADVLAQVQSMIDSAKALLAPYALTLTPSERHEMPKMGDKTLSFVEKAYDLARQNPQFCPSYMDMDGFEVDMADATGLRVAKNSAQQLLQSLDDTAMVAGSEAYQAALLFYNLVKQAATQDIQGAKAVYEELKTRFPHTKRKTEQQ